MHKKLIQVNAIEFGLNQIIGGNKMNSIIKEAVKKISSEPKITKQELTYNENRATELFDGKTIFESFKGF